MVDFLVVIHALLGAIVYGLYKLYRAIKDD